MPKKDFSKEREPIEFTVKPDVFYAHKGIPAETLIEYAAKFDPVAMANADVLEKFASYKEALELCLEPASFQRFVARLKDHENPIDGDQLDEITTWLFEQYGLRPTPPSGNSSDGRSLPAGGIDSTGSIPGEVLISEVSISPTS